MLTLAHQSSGGDYAAFLKNQFFEELMQRLPRPDEVAMELPLIADAESPSTDFTSLGTTWFFCFFRFGCTGTWVL
jgi:hypothetical protein